VSEDPDFVLIGIVRRAHGIRGEVCVEPISEAPGRFESLTRVLLQTHSGLSEVEVEGVRWKGKLALLKIVGIDDRDAAQRLRGARLGVRLSDVMPLPENSYYIFEIVGCKVLGKGERLIGEVVDVLEMPANDVYVVATPKGEVLIPAVKSIVKKVDVENREIVIEEIEGLVD